MLVSPLRYPGGKAKLYPFFSELIRANGLHGFNYCEPFAGGAGLALRLLSNGFVGRVCINDIDSAIYSFWRAALFESEKFCSLIANTNVDIDQWHKQKAVWIANDVDNFISLGFAAYFLNRTNRSGIIEGAGPIGGYHQKGVWKVDVRMNKASQIRNIRTLSKFSNMIEVSNYDAKKFISKVICKKNMFVYLDPPYYVKGKKLYKNFYDHDDHLVIAEILHRKRNSKWVVSYDDVEQIREIYVNYDPITYSLQYSAGEKGKGTEVMYLSDALVPPARAMFPGAA